MLVATWTVMSTCGRRLKGVRRRGPPALCLGSRHRREQRLQSYLRLLRRNRPPTSTCAPSACMTLFGGGGLPSASSASFAAAAVVPRGSSSNGGRRRDTFRAAAAGELSLQFSMQLLLLNVPFDRFQEKPLMRGRGRGCGCRG